MPEIIEDRQNKISYSREKFDEAIRLLLHTPATATLHGYEPQYIFYFATKSPSATSFPKLFLKTKTHKGFKTSFNYLLLISRRTQGVIVMKLDRK